MTTFKDIISENVLEESNGYDEVVSDIKSDVEGNMKLLVSAIKKSKGNPEKSEKAIKNYLSKLERMIKNIKSDLG